MAILVSNPVNHGKGNITGHMVSDSSLKELHGFAKQLGIKKDRFEITSSGFAFYNINIPKRLQAIELGAKEATAAELMKASLKMSKM